MKTVYDILEDFSDKPVTSTLLTDIEKVIKLEIEGAYKVICSFNSQDSCLHANFDFDTEEDEIIFALKYGRGGNR